MNILTIVQIITFLFVSCDSFTPNPKKNAAAPRSLGASSRESSNQTERPTAVLLCPAQFCVPADYQNFLATIQEKCPKITTAAVVNLPRSEWIKVARQLPTSEFLQAKLNNAKTLQWYFNAIETSLAEIYAKEGDNVDICIIGHSIGGWVARSYLGGLSQSSTAVYRTTLERCKSFITLGTPHKSPQTALVDQTRGLLAAVENTEACSPEYRIQRGMKVTCLGSVGVQNKILSTNLEEIIATTSYLPLIPDWKKIFSGVKGDGIIPEDLVFMDAPATRVELLNCSLTGNVVRHAHVLPTPYNLWSPSEASIPLSEDFRWYGSDGVIDQWIIHV
jgi:hypothetical protein